MPDNNIFHVNLYIHKVNGRLRLEIRRHTDNKDMIKKILNSAWDGKPIVVQAAFGSKYRAINNLIDKGVIEYNANTNSYKFLI